MREQDMNQGRNYEMLRSIGKNSQKYNLLLKQSCLEDAANDHLFGAQRSAA